MTIVTLVSCQVNMAATSGYHRADEERPSLSCEPSSHRKPYILSLKPTVQIPAPINQYLRPYQREGVEFLYRNYIAGRKEEKVKKKEGERRKGKSVGGKGALLCDDMGLGKTIQVIAFVCAVLEKSCTKLDQQLLSPKPTHCKGTFLIIVPTSVLYNWSSEIETWSYLKYGIYHRSKKEEVLDQAMRGRLDVVLTTHDTAKTKIDELNSLSWLAVVVDEVHVIKNPDSQVTDALNRLHVKARFGLTGTAFQNNFTELWSLLNWANPGCLGSLKEFQSNFESPILEGQKFDCTKKELATARLKQKELEELLSSWVLRRTKSLISSQLPKKDEFMVFCPATDLQASIYGSILDSPEVKLLVKAHDLCDCDSSKERMNCCYKIENEELMRIRNDYLPLLVKCSNHIGLLLPSLTASNQQNVKAFHVCTSAFTKHPEYLKMTRESSFLTLSDPKYCGKMQVLNKLLTKFLSEGSKVIIFSESIRLLNIIEHYLIRKSLTYSRIDGSTKIEDRTHIINSFNSDRSQFVILISKKCGGTGLNLTGANRVIIFDPSWNPATDNQAEDRAFRIGQCRDVKVFRFITEGTIEEIMYLRQVYKQQLANVTFEGSKETRYFTGVAGDSTRKGEIFGVKNLFQPLRRGASLTVDILKRSDLVELGVKIAVDDTRKVLDSPKPLETADDLLLGAKTIVHSGQKAVVGSSRVEEHISEQALQEADKHSECPANYVEHKLQQFSDESDDIPDHTESDINEDESTVEDSLLGEEQVSPKDDYVERHLEFMRMSQHFGYSSDVEFAKHVKQINDNERVLLLKEYYSFDKETDSGNSAVTTVHVLNPNNASSEAHSVGGTDALFEVSTTVCNTFSTEETKGYHCNDFSDTKHLLGKRSNTSPSESCSSFTILPKKNNAEDIEDLFNL